MKKKDFLKDKIREQFKNEGNGMHHNNADFITKHLNDINSDKIIKANVNNISLNSINKYMNEKKSNRDYSIMHQKNRKC